jgi:hypothetical protein
MNFFKAMLKKLCFDYRSCTCQCLMGVIAASDATFPDLLTFTPIVCHLVSDICRTFLLFHLANGFLGFAVAMFVMKRQKSTKTLHKSLLSR